MKTTLRSKDIAVWRWFSGLAAIRSVIVLLLFLAPVRMRADDAGWVYDVADLVRAARMVEGIIPPDPALDDLDGDGNVTADDLDLMVRRVHGLALPERIDRQTIGPAGGSVGNDQSMELIVPAGVFDQSTALTIDRLSAGEAPLSGIDSGPLYQVSGVPDGVNTSLTIRLPVPVEFDSQDVYFEVGEKTRGSRGFDWYYYLVDADRVGDTLVWTMPPISSLDGWMPSVAGQTLSGETDRSPAASLLAGEADSGYEWRFRPLGGMQYGSMSTGIDDVQLVNDRFRLRFPITYGRPSVVARSNAVQILNSLDAAYTLLSAEPASFDYSQRTRWPIDVYLKKLGAADGNMVSSRLGTNWDFIELNLNLLQDPVKARITAGHEFFHIVQGLYESTSKNLWLDEATATWFEGQMADAPIPYIPPLYEAIPRVALRGMHVEPQVEWQFSWNPGKIRSWNTRIAGSHGYGMSVFIEYLSRQNGWDLGGLRSIYEQIRSGSHPVAAVMSVLPGDTRSAWVDFTRQLLSNQLYPLPEQDYSVKYSMDLSRAFKLKEERSYGLDSDPKRILRPADFVDMREVDMQVQQLGARSLHYFVRLSDPADLSVFPDTLQMVGEAQTANLDDLASLRLMAVLYQHGQEAVILPVDYVDWLMYRSTHRIEVSFPRPSVPFRYLLAVFNDNVESPYDSRIPVTLRSFMGAYRMPQFVAGMIPLTDVPAAEVLVREVLLEGDLGTVKTNAMMPAPSFLPGAQAVQVTLPHDHVESLRVKINAELHEPLTRIVMQGTTRRDTVTVSEIAAPWFVESRQKVDDEWQFTDLATDVSAAQAWLTGVDLPAPVPDGTISYNFIYRFHTSVVTEDTGDQWTAPARAWESDGWCILPIRVDIYGADYVGGQP